MLKGGVLCRHISSIGIYCALGSMLLLDENREVTMLITNSLKNDLGMCVGPKIVYFLSGDPIVKLSSDHASQYVVALALCTLGNICSSEMARDLGPDVERIMRNGPPYLKKKATLCACRIIRKEPEMIENFINLIPSLLNDKNHGVMLAAVSLVTEICNLSPGNPGLTRSKYIFLFQIILINSVDQFRNWFAC